MERKHHARRIFMDVAELEISDRPAAVSQACGADAALRAEVDALLEAHDRAGGFMDSPTGRLHPDAMTVQRTATSPVAGEREGDMIGRYKLLQPIGEGGFGVVWMTEQREPVRRRVALKIIKLGMDTKQVIARFEAERQALAMMDHPNIAKVLDAGSTDSGRPYFVMEYIRGVPVVEYCDAEKMTTRSRLELFAKICAAIQHAHQKGVIHRDIKPSNVLVTMHDGVPVPKVIDFGIAKAAGADLTRKTLFTEHRQMIGTPAYMSPEQAEMSGLDIDTRSDIYSLGVLLYELLTGTTPFDTRELLSKGFVEMMRIIREVEPARPSTRLSTLGHTATRTASLRLASNPKSLGSMIRGDLDWIVMKCLEKDRSRRYESAGSLAADIRRHLDDEPVAAGPPTAGYRLRKFVRRQRARVVAAIIIAATLVLGVIGTSIGMMQATHSARAERAAKIEADGRRREAETNLAFARKGNEILGSVFANLHPGSDFGSVGELRGALRGNLDKAVEQLEGSAIGDPLEVAAMQNTLGIALLGLGEPDKAVAVLTKAAATRTAALGPDDPRTLRTRQSLASAYASAGRIDLALPIAQETLEIRRAGLGTDHPDTLSSMGAVSYLYARDRQIDAAIELAEDALRRARALGAENADVLGAVQNLATIYGMAGRHGLALPLHTEALSLTRASLGPEHPGTLMAMVNLAIACNSVGEAGRAIRLYEEALSLQRAKLGRDHPTTLLTLGNLAAAYQTTGKPDLAVLLFEDVYKLRQVTLGPDHPDTLGGLSHLADAYWLADKRDRAVELFAELVALNRCKFGPDHIDTWRGMDRLASAYQQVGKPDQALALLSEALELRQSKLGANHVDTLVSMITYGLALLHRQDFAKAEPLLLAGYRGLKAQQDLLPPTARGAITSAIDGLIRLFVATERPDEADKWRAERAK